MICKHCNATFQPFPCEIKRGRKYCSQRCAKAAAITPLPKRFWTKVDVRGPDECWLWKAAVTDKGYGKIGVGGRECGHKPAHSVSYELAYGQIPKGKQVNHKCDVRRCVNPNHLYAGTKKQNTQDAKSRNRLAFGERNPQAKLTLHKVEALKMRYAAGGISQKRLGEEYNVSQSQVGRIINGDHWSHAIDHLSSRFR